jgi:hypothetical protein
MEIFWVVVFLISSPTDTHVIQSYGDLGHYPAREACLVGAGEEALKLVHQMYVATRCEWRYQIKGAQPANVRRKLMAPKVPPCKNGRHPSGEPMALCSGFMLLD